MAALLRPPVPRAPTRKGASGFEVWEETRKRGRQRGGPCGQQQGRPVWRKHLTVSPRGIGSRPAGLGQREPRSRGCCWKLASRLDLKEPCKKADATQTQPPGRARPGRLHGHCPRAGAVRGAEARRLREARGEAGRGSVARSVPLAHRRRAGVDARRGRLTWRSSAGAVRTHRSVTAAPAEVKPGPLNADLPRPLSLQGVLPAHHPIQHPAGARRLGEQSRAGLSPSPQL